LRPIPAIKIAAAVKNVRGVEDEPNPLFFGDIALNYCLNFFVHLARLIIAVH
jgi:hypothetical protein